MTRAAKKALVKERRMRNAIGYDVNKVIADLKKTIQDQDMTVDALKKELEETRRELKEARRQNKRQSKIYQAKVESLKAGFNVKLMNIKGSYERQLKARGSFDSWRDGTWNNCYVAILNSWEKEHPGLYEALQNADHATIFQYIKEGAWEANNGQGALYEDYLANDTSKDYEVFRYRVNYELGITLPE